MKFFGVFFICSLIVITIYLFNSNFKFLEKAFLSEKKEERTFFLRFLHIFSIDRAIMFFSFFVLAAFLNRIYRKLSHSFQFSILEFGEKKRQSDNFLKYMETSSQLISKLTNQIFELSEKDGERRQYFQEFIGKSTELISILDKTIARLNLQVESLQRIPSSLSRTSSFYQDEPTPSS